MNSLYDLGGQGTPLHLAVANGFPPAVYQPLLTPFTETYRVVSLPPRPLWQPAPPPETLTTWRMLADDLLAGMAAHDLRDVISVGHSFGGAAALLAAAAEPERFRALILLDPTLLPPALLSGIEALRAQGGEVRFPMVDGALKRRARFASQDEAFAYWRAKPLFADWSDDLLRLYTTSVLQQTEAGGGFALTWSPEWEARGYQTIETTVWAELPKLRGRLPVLVMQAETTEAFPDESAALLRDLLPDAAFVQLDGVGHLFPLSHPDRTGALIAAWLRQQSV